MFCSRHILTQAVLFERAPFTAAEIAQQQQHIRVQQQAFAALSVSERAAGLLVLAQRLEENKAALAQQSVLKWGDVCVNAKPSWINRWP